MKSSSENASEFRRLVQSVSLFREHERLVAKNPDLLSDPTTRKLFEATKIAFDDLESKLAPTWRDQPMRGMLRLIMALEELTDDKDIQECPPAWQLLTVMIDLLGSANPTAEKVHDVLQPLVQVVTANKNRAAAQARNAGAKAWVRQEWARRPDPMEAKAIFAERYESLVAERFEDAKGNPLKVSADTIKRYWLPKDSGG